jgi:hypothetical protein
MKAQASKPEPKTGTVRDLFGHAMEAERHAFLFYEMLVRGFAGSPDIAAFWRGMMEDELKHIQHLGEIADSLPVTVLARAADPSALDMARRISTRLGKLRILSIRDLDDACEAAHEKEDSEINHLFMLLAQNFIAIEDRRAFYSSEIEHHQARLASFSRTYGDRDQRRRILFVLSSQGAA